MTSSSKPPSVRPARFCPKCGKTAGPFIGLFCRGCYLKDHPALVTIPPKLELEQCNYCQRIRIQSKWVEYDVEMVRNWMASKVKTTIDRPVILVEWKPDPKKPKEFHMKTHVTGEIDGQPVEFGVHSTLVMRGGICNDDMLVSSDYYEGIIQVRFTEKSVEKIRKIQEEIDTALIPLRRIDAKAQVVNWVLQKHGFDAWIVSAKATKAAAVAISRAHKGTMSVSGKLIGLDVHSSKTKNRLTFLVRIP